MLTFKRKTTEKLMYEIFLSNILWIVFGVFSLIFFFLNFYTHFAIPGMMAYMLLSLILAVLFYLDQLINSVRLELREK
jgi:hypothetical protein